MSNLNELQVTGKINQLYNKNEEAIYPISVSKAIYMEDGSTNLQEEIIQINLNNVKYNPEKDIIEYFNGTAWISLDDLINSGSGNTGSSVLKENLTVAGVSVGNLTSGTVIPAGATAIDIFKQMLVKIIPPIYTQPTVNMTSNITSAEIGSTIAPTINVIFNKNDAGNLITCVIKDDGTIISENNSITIPPFTLSNDKNYTTSLNYEEGPIKNNNIGQPDGNGHILAGTKTSSVTIKAYRPCFGFAATDSSIPTSEYIRGKPIYGLNLNNNGTIKVVTQANSRVVCFAYPATLRDCIKIRYEDLNDDNNKTAFSSTILSIADASGANHVDYRVYYYIAPVPFGLSATFTLTV